LKVKSLYIEGDLWYVGSDNGLHISENAGVTWITKTTNDGLAHVKIKSEPFTLFVSYYTRKKR